MTAVLAEGAALAGRSPFGCAACGHHWLAREALVCPACGRAVLEPSPVRVDGEPELALPFAIDRAGAVKRLREHVADVPYRCAAAVACVEAPVAHWVPLWLVDARCVAQWTADVGFDEQVMSTVERFEGGVWRSSEVEETRVRWEGRAGTCDRRLENVEVPALRRWSAWRRWVTDPSPDGRPVQGARPPTGSDPILLPDLPVDDAWPAAEAALRDRLAPELARAAAARHLRELYLDARWEERRWTWLLVPAWSVAYRDPRGEVRVLRVDGITGAVTGPVVASHRRAAWLAGALAATGLFCLALSFVVAVPGILLWPLLLLAAAGAIVGFLFLALALVPFLRVLAHNASITAPEPL